MNKQISILGWGSLIWDKREKFDDQHDEWRFDGPTLPIEFSRISQSRGGSLTLVIDPDNGAKIKTAYCISQRKDLSDSIEDLRIRENTAQRFIGYISKTGDNQYRDQETLNTIRTWATEKDIDNVVWTDLPGNFFEVAKQPFSVDNAIKYIHTLSDAGQQEAHRYVNNAPDFVQTPLRAAFDKK